MAKKVKQDGERKEERKTLFEPPEFDERQYLTEELGKMKVSLVFMVIAIPFGAIGAYLGFITHSGWPGLVVAFLAVPVGYLLLKAFMDIDLLAGKKRDLVMAVGVFLVSWLVFAILFSNPPFLDTTEPSITDVRVFVEKPSDPAAGWTLYMLMGYDKDQPDAKLVKDSDLKEGYTPTVGDNLTVMVRAADATGIRSVKISWYYSNLSGIYIGMGAVSDAAWAKYGDRPAGISGQHYYSYLITNATKGNLYFKIEVVSNNGKTRTFTTAFLDSVPVV